MTIEQATTFLAGSILTGFGAIIVGSVILVLNNLFAKHWKPVQIFWIPETMRGPSPRFVDDHVPSVEPVLAKDAK